MTLKMVNDALEYINGISIDYDRKQETITIYSEWQGASSGEIQLKREKTSRMYYNEITDNEGLDIRLNAIKKRLVKTERAVIRRFRFTKQLNEYFNTKAEDTWYVYIGKKRITVPAIYITGIADLRIGKIRGEWRLISFGFGWMQETITYGYLHRDDYPFESGRRAGVGVLYFNSVDIINSSKNVLKDSLLLLREILTKPEGRTWHIQD